MFSYGIRYKNENDVLYLEQVIQKMRLTECSLQTNEEQLTVSEPLFGLSKRFSSLSLSLELSIIFNKKDFR